MFIHPLRKELTVSGATSTLTTFNRNCSVKLLSRGDLLHPVLERENALYVDDQSRGLDVQIIVYYDYCLVVGAYGHRNGTL